MEALKHLLEALFSLKSPFKSLLRIKFLFFHDEFFSSIRLRWLPKANSLLEKFEVDGGMEESSTNIPILVANTFLPTVDLVDY